MTPDHKSLTHRVGLEGKGRSHRSSPDEYCVPQATHMGSRASSCKAFSACRGIADMLDKVWLHLLEDRKQLALI